MSRPLTASSILETKGSFDKNPDRRRIGEPIPPESGMIKPKSLKGLAGKLWDEYAPICEGMGTAARGDEPAFQIMCEEWQQYRKDKKEYPTSRLSALIGMLASFGLNGGGSRAKLGSTSKKDERKDPADKYLNATIGPGNSVRQ